MVLDMTSTLCKYDIRKGDLFVLHSAMVRRVRRGSISSELLMNGGVRSILLLPLAARWNVCCVAAVVKDNGVEPGVWKYVVCLCKGCDGCCVFCFYCDAWSCRCSCMGSMSVSSCR